MKSVEDISDLLDDITESAEGFSGIPFEIALCSGGRIGDRKRDSSGCQPDGYPFGQ